MSIVHEEIEFKGLELMVLEKQKGECVGRGEVIELNAWHERMTPGTARQMAQWLTEQADRIDRQYTKTGKPK